VEALKFGFVEMMEDIGKWLVVGLIVAGLITVLVPDSFFEVFKDNTLLSMLLVLCVSVPMYICATGSIPIAVALMMKGLTPGAALVMLMAGPACNVASILVVNKVLGKKTLLLYLVAIIGGSILFGFGIDYLLPREWFTDHLSNTHACCHDVASWFEWLCTGVLVLLLLNVLRMRLMHKSACSCGHEHGHEHGHHCHCHLATKTYTVKGMTCNHCRANTEKVIRTVKGVESVSVDLSTGIATVTGDDIDDTAIREAVESIGFTLES
jgi:copper chaperone CopZ